MPEAKKTTKKETKASLKEMKTEIEKDAADRKDQPKSFQMKVINKVRKLKNRANSEVVDRSKKVEKLHKKVAAWPLDQMAKVDRLEEIAEDLTAIQEKTIKHSYDLIRTTVKKVDDINNEILKRVEKRLAA